MEINQLIQKGFSLKQKIDNMTAELREINKQIADAAEYKEGSRTGHILTSDFAVKVSLRENVKWDTKKLMEIKNYFADKFDAVVKYEIKPDVKKINKEGGEIEKAFNWAKEVTAGQPSVSYELITEHEEAA
jgi:hypothetical protein